tara:strand:+ start:778 stop:975 length:198 start_codon:yes stop_codon:yes gene_type:complete
MAKKKEEIRNEASIWTLLQETGSEKTEVMSVVGGCVMKCSTVSKQGTTLSVAFIPGAKLRDGKLL